MGIKNSLKVNWQGVLQKIKYTFCIHKYISFKVGKFPLVACYCEKCGTIKIGNCVYYDGTTYQTKLRGEQSIEYLQEKIDYLTNRENNKVLFKKNTGFNFISVQEVGYLSRFETVEGYKKILKKL